MGVMKISQLQWNVSLHNEIKKASASDRPARVAVLGIGNELDGDDAAGMLVVRALQPLVAGLAGVRVIEAGTAPENFTGTLRRFAPDLVIAVDAAWLGLAAGRAAWLSAKDIDGVGALTHGLPLSMLGRYLTNELGCHFGILAIQVLDTGFGQAVTLPVAAAYRRVARSLARLFYTSIG
jgi:hydrogenase 3 maturation protease